MKHKSIIRVKEITDKDRNKNIKACTRLNDLWLGINRGTNPSALRHSPLLEVNRIGSLLIVNFNASNQHAHRTQARAQRLLGSGKIQTQPSRYCIFVPLLLPLTPFLPSRPLRRVSFSFKLFSESFSSASNVLHRFPSPLFAPVSLYLSLSIPQMWLQGFMLLRLESIGNKSIHCPNSGITVCLLETNKAYINDFLVQNTLYFIFWNDFRFSTLMITTVQYM